MIASIKSVFLMDSCLQQKLIKCKKRNYQKKKKNYFVRQNRYGYTFIEIPFSKLHNVEIYGIFNQNKNLKSLHSDMLYRLIKTSDSEMTFNNDK